MPAWLVLIPLALLYFLPNYSWTPDGVHYAADVAVNGWDARLHPHHVGYAATGWVLVTLLESMGVEAGAFEVLSWLSRIAAIGSLVVAYSIFRRSGLTEGWAVLGTLLVGTAYTFWIHGTSAAVYVPTLLCLLLLYRELLRPLNEEPIRWEWAALWLLIATLWHQLAILAVIPTLLWGMYHAPRGRRLVTGIRGSLVLIVPIATAYLLAWNYLHQQGQARSFFGWATRYGQRDEFWWWTHIPPATNPWSQLVDLQVTSHGELFLALPWRVRFPPVTNDPVANALQAMTYEQGLETLLALAVPLLLLGVLLGGWILWREHPTWRASWALAALWTAPFALFLTAFTPDNAFYRLYYFVPLLVLAFAPVAASEKPRVRLTGAAAGIAMVMLALGLNYSHAIAPSRSPTVNPYLVSISKLHELPPGPICFVGSNDWLEFYYAELLADRVVYKVIPLGDDPPPADVAVPVGTYWFNHSTIVAITDETAVLLVKAKGPSTWPGMVFVNCAEMRPDGPMREVGRSRYVGLQPFNGVP